MPRPKGWSSFQELYLLPRNVYQKLFAMLNSQQQNTLKREIIESHEPDNFMPSSSTVLSGPESHQTENVNEVPAETIGSSSSGASAEETAVGSKDTTVEMSDTKTDETPQIQSNVEGVNSMEPPVVQSNRVLKRSRSEDDDQHPLGHKGAVSCTVCGNTFTRQSSLVRHMEMIHGIKRRRKQVETAERSGRKRSQSFSSWTGEYVDKEVAAKKTRQRGVKRQLQVEVDNPDVTDSITDIPSLSSKKRRQIRARRFEKWQ